MAKKVREDAEDADDAEAAEAVNARAESEREDAQREESEAVRSNARARLAEEIAREGRGENSKKGRKSAEAKGKKLGGKHRHRTRKKQAHEVEGDGPSTDEENAEVAERMSRQHRSARFARLAVFLLVVLAALMLTVQIRDSFLSFESTKVNPAVATSAQRMRYTYVHHDGVSGAAVLAPLCLLPRRGAAGFRAVVPADVPRTCATLVTHGLVAKLDTSTLLCAKHEQTVLFSSGFFPQTSQSALEVETVASLQRAHARGEVLWIEEDTALLVLGATLPTEPAGGLDLADNSALFEQAGIMSHIKANPTMYRLSPGAPSGAIVLERERAWLERTPNVSEFEHEAFFRGYFAAALHPMAVDRKAPLDVAVPGIVRVRTDINNAGLGTILQELLPNRGAGLKTSHTSRHQRVCFRRAVIPTRLVDKTVTYNTELWERAPQSNNAQSGDAGTQYFANSNQPPRDWLFFREQAFGILNIVPNVAVERRVVYMRRRFTRVMGNTSEELLLTFLSGLATRRGYDFEVVDFMRESFERVVRAVHPVAMLVGVHGHNLMPTYFMQPKTVVVEILPYKFSSKRYVEGIARRLKYVPIAISTGNDSLYPELTRFAGDRPRCMRESASCLARFRYDHEQLVFTNSDAEQLRSKLSRAFDYLRNTFFPELQ